MANHALEQAGQQQKIDHRSYADQNNGLQATIHEGTSVTQLRRQGNKPSEHSIHHCVCQRLYWAGHYSIFGVIPIRPKYGRNSTA